MSRINTNVGSLIAQKTLSRSQVQLQESLTRLSSGLRINSGKDDPAGLIASENLRSDITAVNKALTNSDRANQFISTADSALGQVSSLLNDIRGLVTEAANAGVLSSDQVAANQLQIDSSLEAIDRIAQTTQFQGKKLLDGSQAFSTAYTAGGSSVRDLNINQANLGSTGNLAVDVQITAAATKGSLTATIPASGAGTPAIAASAQLAFADTSTIDIEAATVGAAGNGTAIEILNDQGTKSFTTLTFNSGATVRVETDTAGAAMNGFRVNIVNDEGTAATGTITFDNGATINVTAATPGTALTGTDLQFVDSGAVAAGTATASYSVATNKITVNVNGDTDRDVVAAALDSLIPFSATTTGTGSGYVAANDAGLLVNNASFTSGGVDPAVAAGAASASYNSGTKIMTVTVNGDTTKAAIAGAITTLGGFTTQTGGAGAGYVALTDANYNSPLSTGGFNPAVASGSADATYDSGLNKITVRVNGNTAKGVIATAIDNLAEFTASTTGGGTGYSAINDSAYVPPSLANGANQVAATGGLIGALALKISGATGSEVFQFNAGASITQIRDGINLLKDATGVSASFTGTTLTLQSDTYGSKNAVAVEVISEGAGGTFGSSLSGTQSFGTDVQATINGYQATASGNTLALKNSTIDFSLTVTDGSTTAVGFNITGGGALFQLGPDVVGNQQARIGINSVQTGTLGGISGRLYDLKSGNAKSLANDANGAAVITDEVINKITSLRGRLGAFQKTTLESNINSLNDTLTNLTAAESSIRDADFAVESAKLTRNQILVQSGNQVLQIANTQPQNVLSLLRG